MVFRDEWHWEERTKVCMCIPKEENIITEAQATLKKVFPNFFPRFPKSLRIKIK